MADRYVNPSNVKAKKNVSAFDPIAFNKQLSSPTIHVKEMRSPAVSVEMKRQFICWEYYCGLPGLPVMKHDVCFVMILFNTAC